METINLQQYLPKQKRFICSINNCTIDAVDKFISKYPTTMIFIENPIVNKIDKYDEKRRKNRICVSIRRAFLREKQKEFYAYCEKVKLENIKLRNIIKKLQSKRNRLLNKYQ